MGEEAKIWFGKVRQAADRTFSWRGLYSVLEAKLFANLYIWLLIMPWLVKLTAGLPQSVSVRPFEAQPDLLLNLNLPFSWYALYFSATFFVLARIVYILFCPKFLRDYSSAGEADSRGLSIQFIGNEARDFLSSYFRKSFVMTSSEFSRLEDILRQYRIEDLKIFMMKEIKMPIGGELRKLLEEVVLTESPSKPSYYQIDGQGRSLTVEKAQLFKHVFWDLHRFQDSAYPIPRLLCTVFVATGALLFGFVALQGLLFVGQQVFTFA